MDNLASEICRRIAIIRENNSNSPPKRKMEGKWFPVIQLSVEKASADPIKWHRNHVFRITIRRVNSKKKHYLLRIQA